MIPATEHLAWGLLETQEWLPSGDFKASLCAAVALPLLEVSQGLPDELHAHFHAVAALQGISRRCQQHVCHLFYHGPHVRDVLHINETACDNAVGPGKLPGSSWQSDSKAGGTWRGKRLTSCLRPSGSSPVQKTHLFPASCQAPVFPASSPRPELVFRSITIPGLT